MCTGARRCVLGALGMLQDVCGEEATAQMLLKAKLVGNVTGWVTAKDGDVKRLALSCCSQLSAHECCAGEIGSKEFLGTLTLMMRTKVDRRSPARLPPTPGMPCTLDPALALEA